MAAAIETGIPKMRIEEAAARTQARIDSGTQKIIGINEYRLEHEDPIDILEIDNTAVREQQVARLKDLRAHRDEKAVQEALKEITASVQAWADGGKGENLLALAVKAAGLRATYKAFYNLHWRLFRFFRKSSSATLHILEQTFRAKSQMPARK